MNIQQTQIIFERGQRDRKVTVIVPLHNYAELIEETLTSVAEQTFADLALIVVDDDSSDDSRGVCERWMRQADAPQLAMLLVANQGNAGLSVTRNTGIDLARSQYCFFLDADNLLLPRCIEKHVRALEGRPDCIGAYSIIQEFGGISGLIGANVFSRERLKRGNYIDAMAMLRRERVIAAGGFQPIKHGWEDYELWLRLCSKGERLLHLPQVLSQYRNHNRSMLRQQTNVGQNILDLHRNIERLHPWVTLDAPRTQSRRSVPAASTTSPQRSRRAARSRAVPNLSGEPYAAYRDQIMGRLANLSERKPLPVNVRIDSDYTGPVHGTPFDAFVSPRQRRDSEKHTIRMLQLGIVGINPRPGVHAARGPDGDFIRYRSIPTGNEPIADMPDAMLIHIHAFYPDVVEEMLGYFTGQALQGRFLVTTTTTKNHDAVERILADQGFANAQTLLIDNKGRDIGPFLDHVVPQLGDGDVVCHVHTKKSPDVGGSYGEKWRRLLYGALLNQDVVDASRDDRLGLLFPDSARAVGWGKNRPFCEAIAARLGCRLQSHPGPIPIGNMFLAHASVARAMQQATQGMDWPREPVPYDGSVLHAIERMWTLACEKAGMDWATSHAAPGNRAGDGPA